MLEFDWIAEFTQRAHAQQATANHDAHILLGIGDDCAVLDVAGMQQLAISTDTFAEGIHFFTGTDPALVAHKALAVNLSDLAAMGARPRWFTLALSVPSKDYPIARFADGLFALAQQHQIQLIGGDTTKGAMSITMTVLGELMTGDHAKPRLALQRSAAQAGDLIFVSGDLGGARAAVERRYAGQSDIASFSARLDQPTPRVALGLAIRRVANACIDLSDGLLADLQHICQQSRLSAELDVRQLPLHPDLLSYAGAQNAFALALSGGDDYELCFTAAAEQKPALEKIAIELDLRLTVIGHMRNSAQRHEVISWLDGSRFYSDAKNFSHF